MPVYKLNINGKVREADVPADTRCYGCSGMSFSSRAQNMAVVLRNAGMHGAPERRCHAFLLFARFGYTSCGYNHH